MLSEPHIEPVFRLTDAVLDSVKVVLVLDSVNLDFVSSEFLYFIDVCPGSNCACCVAVGV